MAVVKRFALDGITYDIEPTNIDAVPTEGSNNTVSSSGVKSYVDSNYVPLSATQAPVTGLTDILTPVNLLPNSDFSRNSCGHNNPRTYATLSTGTNSLFKDTWYIRAHESTYSNVSLNTSDGTATLSFIPVSSTREDGHFIIRLQCAALSKNVMYTAAFTIDSYSGDGILSITPGFSGTSTIIYRNNQDPLSVNRRICIGSVSGSGESVLFNITMDANSAGKNFTVVLKDFSLYEGEFKNPPITTSLDIKPSRQFLFENMLRKNGFYGANDLGRVQFFYSYPNVFFNRMTGVSSYINAKKNYILIYPAATKKIKVFLFSKNLSANSSALIQMNCFTRINTNINVANYSSSFIQTLGWKEVSTTSITNVFSQKHDLYSGSSSCPVTFSVEHVDNSYYSNVFAIIDCTNVSNTPLLFIEMFDVITNSTDVDWSKAPDDIATEVVS